EECNDHYSYSSCAKDKGAGTSDPDLDFMEIDEKMSENGWNQETVKRLANDIGQTIFNKKVADANPSRCGSVDYYLYKFTDGTYELGGYAWSNFIEQEDMTFSGNPLENEILIKFGYGYHNTKYGRLVIEQNLGSIEEFMRIAKEQIPIYLLNLLCNTKNWQIIAAKC
ncbi:MAG: hypothetical protein EBZ77_06965, partial [Chitinophagia bacterium]|nr:hypothetical protein [Chitinophagia bacterium]